ncbi:MAG: Uma2 family endonuclease [Moorea sp. SIO2B7]|nr:Uma2 family endonuclease [Moorena sp. SIO2B7]
MIQTPIKSLTLKEFLNLPETKPVSEYIEGQIIKKTMPKARHSRLQNKIIEAVNTVGEAKNIAYAFPELRCTFGGRSIVPDITVLKWKHIKFNDDGEPLDDIYIAPDWTIEILSPGQSSHKVIGNILHCLKNGCQLGWLIDPDDRSILVFKPKQEPELYYGKDIVTVLQEIELELTVAQLFSWLQMNK